MLMFKKQLLLAVPLAIAAAGLFVAGGDRPWSNLQFVPDETTIEECGENYACLRQAYANLAYRDGIEVAGDRFRSALKADPYLASRCHLVGHSIGIATLARLNGRAAEALLAGFPDCSNGFYHGVMLNAFGEIDSTRPDLLGAQGRAVCSDPRILADKQLTLNCVHGTGHGYMIATEGNIDLALAACESAGEVGYRTRYWCDNGVFMEAFLPSTGSTSEYASADDPFRACRERTLPAPGECYIYAGALATKIADDNPPRAIEICESAPEVGRAICLANAGSFVAHSFPDDQARVIEICRLASEAGPCLRGAAKDAAIRALDDEPSAQISESFAFCDAAPETSGYCYFELGQLFSRDPSGRAELLCNTVDDVGLSAICMAGAKQNALNP